MSVFWVWADNGPAVKREADSPETAARYYARSGYTTVFVTDADNVGAYRVDLSLTDITEATR